MSKVYQHIYSADKDGMHTISASEEMIREVSDYLERTICSIKNLNGNDAVYAAPLTVDTIVIGKATSLPNGDPPVYPHPNNYFHNYIVSNIDAAKIISKDPCFVSKIAFKNGPVSKTDNSAQALNALPLTCKGIEIPDKISGTMLQNAYGSLMNIIADNSMKYMSIDESFSPMEIISLAYSVLPIHAALKFSYITYVAGIPKIKYNLCFTESSIVENIKSQNRLSAASLFSSDQSLSVAEFVRMSQLLNQSSIDLSQLRNFYRFAYDFINIVNKHIKDELDPLSMYTYEKLLCIYKYTTEMVSSSRSSLPEDILASIEWMENLIKLYPSFKNDIRQLVPMMPKDSKPQSIPMPTQTAKRAEREMATKIIALILANPSDYDSFAAIKYQVMREVRLETFSLSLFQKTLREALMTYLAKDLDDSRKTMAAMAISLAFEVSDYKKYGAECISFAPYDYESMLDFIWSLSNNSKIIQKEILSLHRTNPLSIAMSKIKKTKKKDINNVTDDFSDLDYISDDTIITNGDINKTVKKKDKKRLFGKDKKIIDNIKSNDYLSDKHGTDYDDKFDV